MKITKLDKLLFFENSHIVYGALAIVALFAVVASTYNYTTYEPKNIVVNLSEYGLDNYNNIEDANLYYNISNTNRLSIEKYNNNFSEVKQ